MRVFLLTMILLTSRPYAAEVAEPIAEKGTAATVHGSPALPTNTNYSALSPEEQKNLEAAAFLLNLRSLGILRKDGPICASVSKDRNGNPRFKFSIQGEAFEAGSCAVKKTSDTVAKLHDLAQASSAYYKEVRHWSKAVPLDVQGFADGQQFSTLGTAAKATCPELANAKPMNGSFNQPLARARAQRVVDELGLKNNFDIHVGAFSSPKLEKTDTACFTRRQVVISVGGLSSAERGVGGEYEPEAQIDEAVQLAMNSAVSLGILRAHEKLKSSADCLSEKTPNDRSVCQWKHVQRVMTELGIKENDTACRASTIVLANELITRADSAFAEGTPNSTMQKEMLRMADDPEFAAQKVKAFVTAMSEEGPKDPDLGKCGTDRAAALHIAMPTADMLNPTDPACARKSMLSGALTFAERNASRILALSGAATALKQAPAGAAHDAAQKKYDELNAEMSRDFPGVQSTLDLAAYKHTINGRLGRRSVSHNCVRPDPAILAIGYEVSPNQSAFFQDPAKLGKVPMKMQYSENTFSTYFHPEKFLTGFGCSVCGSGLRYEKDHTLKFSNGITDGIEAKKDLRAIYGADGLALLESDSPTAASFMAPAVYEIPNCAGCKCIANMKDALKRALAKPALLHSTDLKHAQKMINPKSMGTSCLFTPAVAHACPAGPAGHSERSIAAVKNATRLTYITSAMNAAKVTVTGDFRNALDAILTAPGSCVAPLTPTVPGSPAEIREYQNLVDEVVCETKSPPVRLPSTGPGSEERDCAGVTSFAETVD